ncbi:MAG: hypothetical protein ACK6D7_21840 [Acidobacteriota bacterium]
MLRTAAAGFSLVVGLVLLAVYLGQDGSRRIRDTAQEMIRETLPPSLRSAEIESWIIRETRQLTGRPGGVLGLCFLLAAGTPGPADSRPNSPTSPDT